MFDGMFLGSGRCACSRPKDKNGEGEGHHSGHAHGGIDKHVLPAFATGTGREMLFVAHETIFTSEHALKRMGEAPPRPFVL